MPLWSSADLLRFLAEGEDAFATDYPCIVDRYCLDVVAGTAQYVLPDYILDIRRITWKGHRLNPLPQRDLRESRLSGTESGRPYWYITNNIGKQKIQLYPVPSETVTSTTADLWGASISTKVIVEYFRTPDTGFEIPLIFKRRFLKCYVLKRCFEIEGKGQNLKAAKYFNDKWNALFELYGTTYEELINKARKLIASSESTNPYGILPPPPVLPIDRYGRGVDL